MKPLVFVYGAFPPPVNGLSTINSKVEGLLKDDGFGVVRLNVARTLRSWRGLIQRMTRTLSAIGRVTFTNKADDAVFYCALSSKNGQLFDWMVLYVASLFGLRLVIHHHNFSYLRAPSVITLKLLRWTSEKAAIHIVLCPSMVALLKENFGARHKVEIVSNLGFVGLPTFSMEQIRQASRGEGTLKVGYLGALTREKGIHDFIDVCKAIKQDRALSDRVEFIVAGGGGDAFTLNELDAARSAGLLSCIGPVFDDDKRRYLDSLDVLLFPSTYPNEAQPLVVFEALTSGITVISYPIACVCDLAGLDGLVIAGKSEFIGALRVQIFQSDEVRWQKKKALANGLRKLAITSQNEIREFRGLFLTRAKEELG